MKWDIKFITPSSSVNFIDMTISIYNNKIIIKTYQKDMNLHLYSLPFSGHPPSCIKGTVYSLVQKYFKQNTYQQDFIYSVGLFYHRLIQWGWDKTTISKLILEATTQAENKSTSLPTAAVSNADVMKDTVFLNYQFHKDGISRQEISKEFGLYLETICKEELQKERMILAFSRPKNIGDFVTRAKVHEAPGKSASTMLGEFVQGSNPY